MSHLMALTGGQSLPPLPRQGNKGPEKLRVGVQRGPTSQGPCHTPVTTSPSWGTCPGQEPRAVGSCSLRAFVLSLSGLRFFINEGVRSQRPRAGPYRSTSGRALWEARWVGLDWLPGRVSSPGRCPINICLSGDECSVNNSCSDAEQGEGSPLPAPAAFTQCLPVLSLPRHCSYPISFQPFPHHSIPFFLHFLLTPLFFLLSLPCTQIFLHPPHPPTSLFPSPAPLQHHYPSALPFLSSPSTLLHPCASPLDSLTPFPPNSPSLHPPALGLLKCILGQFPPP